MLQEEQKSGDDIEFYSEKCSENSLMDFQKKEFERLFDNSDADSKELEGEPILNQFEDSQNRYNFAEGFENDSMILGFTRTQLHNHLTQDVDELDEDVRKLINTKLHQGIDKFSRKLFSDTQIKTLELTQLTTLLRNFKVSKDFFKKDNNLDEQQQQNRRNVRGSRIQVEDHQKSGQPIKFQVCDKAINPFMMSFNQTIILIHNDDPETNSSILDVLDSYFRDQKTETIYIVPERVKEEFVSLSVRFQSGLLRFVIKCGRQDQSIDYLYYAMLRTYVALSETFQFVAAFILYWADKRGILGDQVLPEIALLCMIIDFFQMNDLLPCIFDAKYNFWPEGKKFQMDKILDQKKIYFEDLDKYFNPNEYMIVSSSGIKRNESYKKDVFKRVHFHTFPSESQVNLIQELQAKQPRSKKSKNDQNHGLNYGVLVAKFFHSYARGKIQRRTIDITGVVQIPSESDIGYQVMSPMVPGLCLTRQLAKKIRHGSNELPQAFLAVQGEFVRAYNLITQTKFTELNEKRKTFIQ